MVKRHICTILALLFMNSARVAAGQGLPETPLGVPIYDPDSKRYFALMRSDTRDFRSMWHTVTQQAQSQSFEGVRGRLAIVDSLEVHEFLLRHFPPQYGQWVWIGLRYLCQSRQLEWSDGRIFQPGSFQAWAPNWKIDPYFCMDTDRGSKNYGPVAYSPDRQWVGVGLHKGYDYYFVEFPTGHP